MLTFKDFLEVHSRSQSSCRYVEQCRNSNTFQCGCYDDYVLENSLGRIFDAVCVCDECGWRGTVGEAEPDVDDEGSLECAECLAALDTSEERLKANEATPNT